MTDRGKWLIVAAVAIVLLGGAGVVGAIAWQQYQTRSSAPSAADTVTGTGTGTGTAGDRIVFRNTASGEGYGHVATVPLDDPQAARTIEDIVCDRVDATTDALSCLRTHRGIVPSYSATVYDGEGVAAAEWPLAGVPSRTRVAADGSLVASTAFVTGHSYATIGFSTETVIRTADGQSLGNLEEWTLLIDGAPSAPADRNFWGVTFLDDTTFYATVGLTGTGQTFLVRGDIPARTLETIAENVECPSLSPDGTRIAFKRVTDGAGPSGHWTPAVYDLVSGEVTLLAESRSIDDQIEWLDDDTILYGMPRDDTPGDSDVWRLAADGSGEPTVLIPHAWSPSVVRAA